MYTVVVRRCGDLSVLFVLLALTAPLSHYCVHTVPHDHDGHGFKRFCYRLSCLETPITCGCVCPSPWWCCWDASVYLLLVISVFCWVRSMSLYLRSRMGIITKLSCSVTRGTSLQNSLSRIIDINTCSRIPKTHWTITDFFFLCSAYGQYSTSCHNPFRTSTYTLLILLQVITLVHSGQFFVVHFQCKVSKQFLYIL